MKELLGLKSIDTIGRLHTNLTNIRKEVRPYLTYNHQRLVSLDIKASQPFFSLLLLDEIFYNALSPINIFMFPSLYEFNSFISNINAVVLFIMIVTSSESRSRQGFEAYRDIILQGRFYDVLPTLLNLPVGMPKKELKQQVFTIFYSRNRFLHQPQARTKLAFKNRFPDVYHVFSLLKKSNHRILSHILQRIESYLILERVCYKLSVHYPHMPIFTIHDSIVCTVGSEEKVEAMLTSTILAETGLHCIVKREYW